jgi:hypothetical protein
MLHVSSSVRPAVWQNAVIAVCFQRFYWRHDPEKMRILAEKQYWWDMMVYLFQSGMLVSSELQMHSLRFLLIKQGCPPPLLQSRAILTMASTSSGRTTRTISPTKSGVARALPLVAAAWSTARRHFCCLLC